MTNVGEPRSCKHRLLMTVGQSVFLYGAVVRADALNKKVYQKKLFQVQRKGALRLSLIHI